MRTPACRLSRLVGAASVVALYLATAPAWAGAKEDAEDIRDKPVSKADSKLGNRGYVMVGSGGAQQYWWNRDREDCLQVHVKNGKVSHAEVVDEKQCRNVSRDTAGAGGGAGGFDRKDAFDTVCGVIVSGKNYRYRCKAEDFYRGEKKVETALYYPDQTIRLVWQGSNQVELRFEGMVPQHARFATSEGETNFQFEDKTYFYISNKDAARMEVEHFQD
jgi:hypothetical protein